METENKNNSTTDHQEIVDIFNTFFVEKIEKLKSNIEDELVEDPLVKLKSKLDKKGLNFPIKQVSVKTVTGSINKMKNK